MEIRQATATAAEEGEGSAADRQSRNRRRAAQRGAYLDLRGDGGEVSRQSGGQFVSKCSYFDVRVQSQRYTHVI
jgi:hypothetical protein